jgi:predicted esterase
VLLLTQTPVQEAPLNRTSALVALLLLVYVGSLLLTPRASAADRMVYADVLAAGWENWSWTNNVDFANATPVKSGNASIAIRFETAEKGFALRTTPPLAASQFSALAFSIYGGAGGNQLLVYLQTGDSGPAPATYPLTVPAGVWTDVNIPLNDLGNPAQIARINIQENAGAAQSTFFLDDVRLVGASSVPTEGSRTLMVNGYQRQFVYATSAQPAPVAGRPLVIHLHGDGGNMNLSAAWKNAVLNDSNGAVLVSAQGRNKIPAANSGSTAWDFRMDKSGQPYDDVDFINQLIDEATANATLLGSPINPDQVYVVGESRGAGMAYYLYADPRTRNKIRAIVPISGTFYCEGGEVQQGVPGTQPTPGSDLTCGAISPFGYWAPKPALFSAPGVTRLAHILAIYGQLPAEFSSTAPPQLNVDYGATTWAGWGDAAGCYTVQVSSQTEQTLPQPIGGKTVKSYTYSQAEANLATRCATLDLTFYIVQGGGHVPGGFEAPAWCYLSTVGGNPSSSACPNTNPSPTPITPSPTPITPSPTPITPSPTPSSDVTLNVNVQAARQPISEQIYGLHDANEAFAREIGLPVRRNGGNLASRYNWKTGNTNSGLDYYFANRPADLAVDDVIARDRRTNTQSIITIPMLGWVAKDGQNASCGFNVPKYGYTPQPFRGLSATDPNFPNCGTGYLGSTPGGTLTFAGPVDPTDTSVPFSAADARAWVEDLKARYGAATAGGVRYYALDNEPDLWASTHADLVRTGLTYQQFRDRTVQYAAAVKQADPGAATLGPSLGSYAYYFHSFYDGQREDWATPDDRTANGSTPFLAWYLQQMRAYEQQNSTRLLDYLDVHFYPQNGEYNSAAGSTALQALRLESTRSLWDTSYVDKSWIKDSGIDGGIVKLIPRLRELVANNYPGTKIAISEYSWGAHADLNGALAQAEILGIFGREGVDLATLFDGRYEAEDAKFSPDRPSAYAFRIYRNYDGQGGRFGDTRVQADSSDANRLTIYAAQRTSDGALTLVVINKSQTALTTQLNVAGFSSGANAAVYRYSAANLGAIVRQPDLAISASGLNTSFPAESISLLVVPTNSEVQPAQRVFMPIALGR